MGARKLLHVTGNFQQELKNVGNNQRALREFKPQIFLVDIIVHV